MGAKQRKILHEISNYQNKTDFFCSALPNSFFRKTFFDHIDEEISYPGSLRADFISTVSVSDNRIITTHEKANFNLSFFFTSKSKKLFTKNSLPHRLLMYFGI